MSDKILIIHSGGIGDLILALPAMRIFRRTFPSSALEMMGRPERLALVAHDLGGKTIHSIDRAGMSYFYLDNEVLPKALADFFSSFHTALLFGKAGRETLAGNLKRSGLSRVISLPSFPPEESSETHVSDYLVKSLEEEGIQGVYATSRLQVPPEAVSLAENFLAARGVEKGEQILALHPGSGSAAKNWDWKNFVRVGEWASQNARILLISGPAEKELEGVRKAVEKTGGIPADQLPLTQLAGILKFCTAYLGNDSGITHLAAVLGIPTFAVFGPTNPAVWGPRGRAVTIIYEPHLSAVDPSRAICLLSPLFPKDLTRIHPR